MHFIFFFRVKESMNLSELLIIFVNKVLITPTQGVFISTQQNINFKCIYPKKTVIRGQKQETCFSFTTLLWNKGKNV